MTSDYPDDEDGEAIRRVAEAGCDMQQPMLVDFHIAVPDEPTARTVADAVAPTGYAIELFHEEEEDDWMCSCGREMLLVYDDVMRMQAELKAIAEPLGGELQGWGTFGNADDDDDAEGNDDDDDAT